MITQPELRLLLSSPIAFHKVFAQVGGSINAGLFLSQLYYWSDKGDDADGWIHKKHTDWTAETMLTRQEQITARKHLVETGILQERLSKTAPPLLYFRLDFEALLRAIQALSGGGGGADNRMFASKHSSVDQQASEWLPANIPYNTENTTETTTESNGSLHAQGAHTRGAVVAGVMIPLPDFEFSRQDPKPTAKGSLAPAACKVHIGGYEWAQSEGWRGPQAWLQTTANTCIDYYRGKGQRMMDWQAVLRNWIRRNIADGKDVPYAGNGTHGNGAIAGANVQEGRSGHERPKTGYGYDRAGRPTNRATATVSAISELADRARKRELAEQDGRDANAISRPNGGGH